MNSTKLLTANIFGGGNESEGMEPCYAQIYIDVHIFHLDFSSCRRTGVLKGKLKNFREPEYFHITSTLLQKRQCEREAREKIYTK